MKRKVLPRLGMRDVKELRRCCEVIAAADTTLHNSSWGSAPAVRVLLKGVYETLAELYNRSEPVYLELVAKHDPEQVQAEIAAAAAASRPVGGGGSRQVEE